GTEYCASPSAGTIVGPGFGAAPAGWGGREARPRGNRTRTGGHMPVLSDGVIRQAQGDLLNFRRYLDVLTAVLTEPRADTPFTAGVFGSWGSGKSTLLAMLDDHLETHHPDRFVRVHFNPWIYRGEPNMLVPLLHTLHDTLRSDPEERFAESAKKIG